MSGKWPGGIISKTAPTVTGPTDGEGGSASGIWTLDQAADYEKQGLWPKPVIPKELWSWGSGNHGQLGQGDTTDYSSPVQIGALTDWLKVALTYQNSLAIKTDGTLWAWGRDWRGELGQGTFNVPKSSPVQVGALTDWAEISGGMWSVLTVKTDGTMWAWGNNSYGQLGQGNTTRYSSPVQVGALTTWLKVANGPYHTLATKTDGTLWCWGRGNGGQLGQGNTTDYSSPVQVGALTDWASPAGAGFTADENSYCVKTDGTLWAWGSNAYGQLGLGNTTYYSSPVQVGALTDWDKPYGGENGGAFIKTDGTIWGVGQNSYGELGDSSTTTRSSPVQVGALTTWDSLAKGQRSCAGYKTDGTLWAWGRGTYGALGLGNTTYYSSPKQVGALTTWIKLPDTMTTAQHAMGIKQP